MGLRFAATGANVLLGGAIGPEALKLITETHSQEKGEISFASNVRHTKFTLRSQEEGTDEIHLIMEYSAKEQWGGVESPRANRFIVHCDHTSSRFSHFDEPFNNPRLNALEHFISGQKTFNADVIVIAGLHMLEKEPEEFRTKRLNEVE